MPQLTLVLLAAGNSSRFCKQIKKQWLWIGDQPLWHFVAKRFESFYPFVQIIIVGHPDELNYMKRFGEFSYVKGGESRQASIRNALEMAQSDYVLISDVARACIEKSLIERLIAHYKDAECIVPYIDVSDTVVYQEETIDRTHVKLIQTPQLSKREILDQVLRSDIEYTDESSAIHANGFKRFFVKGSQDAKKITRCDDLAMLACLKKAAKEQFFGYGYDVHPFVEGKQMVLCGVEIDADLGFLAHSDGDVALHALIDALLGAIGAGDIGELFPDSDERFKDISSLHLLEEVVGFIRRVGYEIVNVDITIMAEYPRISPYKDKMQVRISEALKIRRQRCNIKATTTEKLGFVGRKEGVAVSAVASLKYFDWGNETE